MAAELGRVLAAAPSYIEAYQEAAAAMNAGRSVADYALPAGGTLGDSELPGLPDLLPLDRLYLPARLIVGYGAIEERDGDEVVIRCMPAPGIDEFHPPRPGCSSGLSTRTAPSSPSTACNSTQTAGATG